MNDTSKTRTCTVDEAAKQLGIGRNHAYRACQSGDIPTIRIGKRILVPQAALDRMLDGDVVNRGRAE